MVIRARTPGAPGAVPAPGGVRPGAPAQQAQQAPQQQAARPAFRPGVSAQAQQQAVDISDNTYQQPAQQQAPQAGPVRPGAPRPGATQAPAQRVAQAAPVQQQQAYVPAVQQQQQRQVSTQVGAVGPQPKLSDLNPMLAGLEGIGENNRVGLSLAGFEYKKDQTIVQELNIVVSGGAKLWQKWGDELKGEDPGLCQSYDHKTSTDGLICATCPFLKDKSCKFKFEVRWQEPEDDGEGGTADSEKIWTMSTSSAVTWLDYLKDLGKNLGIGSHLVNTSVNYEIKRSANNMYASAMFTPTHWYNPETMEYTEIPLEQQFTTKNKK